MKMNDFLRTLHFRVERIKGYAFAICLMILDEVVSPITGNKQYELPYGFALYLRSLYVPDQYVWEVVFGILSIIFLFT